MISAGFAALITPEEHARFILAHGVEGLTDTVIRPLVEALVLGLMQQGVTKYLAVVGNGSNAIADVLRVYEAAGLVRCWQFRHEVGVCHL